MIPAIGDRLRRVANPEWHRALYLVAALIFGSCGSSSPNAPESEGTVTAPTAASTQVGPSGVPPATAGPSPTNVSSEAAQGTAVVTPATTSGPGSVGLSSPSSRASASSINLGVPAYFVPGPEWEVLLARPDVGVVVFNPASGPGIELQVGYAIQIARAKARGIRVLGYVPTGYGNRISVVDDIAAYQRFYAVNDVFLDETPPDCETLRDSYAGWIDLIHSSGGVAAVNPGMVPESCWADSADIIVTFEGPADAFLRHRPPAYIRSYQPSKFWNIVYAVDPTQVGIIKQRAQSNGVGLIFVTDDLLPNPFDQLPSWHHGLAVLVSSDADDVSTPPSGSMP